MARNDYAIREIPLDEIKVGDSNVRCTQKDKDLSELAASIKKHGLLQPVVLRGGYGNPPYELIVGQRRYLAHEKLQKRTIRATFAGKLTDVQASIRSLAENMHRLELNHADAAKAVTRLYKEFGRDERKVVAETGMSLQRVRQYVDIHERASHTMKRKLRSGQVQPVDVQRVLNAAGGNIAKADSLLEKMKKYELTVHQKKHMVECGQAHPGWSAETVIKQARRQRVERTISVRLSDAARTGLQKASEVLAMSPDEVASQALEQWLSRQGFLTQ